MYSRKLNIRNPCMLGNFHHCLQHAPSDQQYFQTFGLILGMVSCIFIYLYYIFRGGDRQGIISFQNLLLKDNFVSIGEFEYTNFGADRQLFTLSSVTSKDKIWCYYGKNRPKTNYNEKYFTSNFRLVCISYITPFTHFFVKCE